MHELSIATAVVESADAAARRHGAASVESVHLRVGELAGVVADALRFSFDLAAEGTSLEGARLVIEDVPARARCGGCPGDFAVGSPPCLECPGCRRPAAELLTGRELEIAAVTLPDPAPAPPAGAPTGPDTSDASPGVPPPHPSRGGRP